MPQVYMVLGSECPVWLKAGTEADDLATRFEHVVEKSLSIERENDTAHTIVLAKSTRREADVQVEIRYTAGKDEYGRGEPFDPTEKKREALVEALRVEFVAFQTERAHVAALTFSVWVIPLYNSTFKMWK